MSTWGQSARTLTYGTFAHYTFYPPLRSNFQHFPFRILPYALRNSAVLLKEADNTDNADEGS